MQEPYETQIQSCVGMIPWRKAWQPSPVFLPRESYGQRSLAGYSPWDSPAKSTGVCYHSLLQGIFLTQESKPGLLHCRQILYQMTYSMLL